MFRSVLSTLLLSAMLAMPAVSQTAQEGELAPDFTLPGVRDSDRDITLSELRGNIVYVDFWASWCLPCLRSLPQINGLYENYADQGFEVVAITIDDPIEDALDFLEDLEIPLNYHVVADLTADVMGEYGVVGMPTSFLIDRSGTIQKVHKGFREGDTDLLEQALIALLAADPR